MHDCLLNVRDATWHRLFMMLMVHVHKPVALERVATYVAHCVHLMIAGALLGCAPEQVGVSMGMLAGVDHPWTKGAAFSPGVPTSPCSIHEKTAAWHSNSCKCLRGVLVQVAAG